MSYRQESRRHPSGILSHRRKELCRTNNIPNKNISRMLAGRDVDEHITRKRTNGIIIHHISVMLYLMLNITVHINSISDLSLKLNTCILRSFGMS